MTAIIAISQGLNGLTNLNNELSESGGIGSVCEIRPENEVLHGSPDLQWKEAENFGSKRDQHQLCTSSSIENAAILCLRRYSEFYELCDCSGMPFPLDQSIDEREDRSFVE